MTRADALAELAEVLQMDPQHLDKLLRVLAPACVCGGDAYWQAQKEKKS